MTGGVATILSHALVAITASRVAYPGDRHYRIATWATALSIVPDLDVLTFAFGIQYGDFFLLSGDDVPCHTHHLRILAALDLQVPETQPVYNLFSQLIYAASSRQFSDVWVSGKRLLHDGRLTTIDIASVLEAAEHWCSQLSGGISSSNHREGGSTQ